MSYAIVKLEQTPAVKVEELQTTLKIKIGRVDL